MGFLNKKPVIRQKGFHPLELNEDNVRAIFNRCLATDDTKNLTAPILFALKNGYSEDSKPIVFDKDKITANSATIEYLFAQLHDVHTSKGFIAPMSVTIKYDKSTWTQSKGIILEFLHLGYAAHLFNACLLYTSRLIAEARETKSGRNVSFFDVEVRDQNGTLLGSGSFSYYRLDKEIVL